MKTGILRIIIVTIYLFSALPSFSQTCTATVPASPDQTWGSLSWTSGGGATCPPTSASNPNNVDIFLTMENNSKLTIDDAFNMVGDFDLTIGNGAELVFDVDVNITGNFPIDGNSATITINSGADIYVSEDMGDPTNNNTTLNVEGTLTVDGTLSAKNGADFSGSGTITGGTLDLGNGATCGSPCPVAGGFTNCSAGGTFCADNTVTPIILLDFKSKVNDNSVELLWSTSYEENFDYFSLQRSKSGKEYYEITQVKGIGWSTQINNYSYTDYSPLNGKTYYRLESIDFDGYTEIFDAIAVNYTETTDYLSIYPNPATGNGFEFSISITPNGTELADLYTLHGNLIRSIPLEESVHKYKISDQLEKGTYLLKVKVENQILIKRFVVN